MKKPNHLDRKHFLKTLVWGTAGSLLFVPQLINGQKKIDKGPQLEPALVKEFVTKGHGDLARTKEMLAETPALLNASWDWGGGDFETALEGASHLGNKEIANFLLEKEAKITIFTMAMLGKLTLLKPILTAFPAQLNAFGPHKLGLMHHAKKGGEEAKEVVEYLKYLGLKD